MTGEHDGSCASCGAPLAHDQRWCLECGARRAGLSAPALGSAPASPGAPSQQRTRDRASLTFVAVVACLLVALALGVLIGRSRDVRAAATDPAPREVITVSVPASGSVPAATTTPAPAATTTNTTATTPSTTSTTPPSDEVKKLDDKSGQDYQKESEKLPNQVGTGGEPPKEDRSKPAGGGSDVTEIG